MFSVEVMVRGYNKYVPEWFDVPIGEILSCERGG